MPIEIVINGNGAYLGHGNERLAKMGDPAAGPDKIWQSIPFVSHCLPV
jgi:hypothetical protein